MLDTNNNLQVYLAPGATDMRKSIDGLAIWVSEMMELDPCSSTTHCGFQMGSIFLKAPW